jgi:hypothetical protein
MLTPAIVSNMTIIKYIPGETGMRKLVFIFMLTILSTLTYAQSPNPFTDGRWQGHITYKDSGGTTHSDLYEIIFVKNGTCIVTVQTKENGADLFQDGDGLWSYDNDFLRIECDFIEPVITRLPGIRWVSLYQFDNTRTRFTLLVPPFMDTRNMVRIAFVQTKE